MTEWVLPPAIISTYEAAGPTGRRSTAVDRSGRSSAPAASGGTSRRSIAESDEMYARMLGPLEAAGGAGRPRRRRPRGPRGRPPRALPGPVQLPVLARGLRRPVPARTCGTRSTAPDRAPQRPRRRRGQDRPARLAGGGRLQPRRPAGGPAGERPAGRLRPPGASAGTSTSWTSAAPAVNVLATLDRRPEPYHGTIRDAVRTRGSAEQGGRAVEHPRPGRPEAGGAGQAPRLRSPPPQGAGRPLLPARRDASTTWPPAGTSSAATSPPAPTCRRPTARTTASP